MEMMPFSVLKDIYEKDFMDYKLIYVNKMGFNHRGYATYEFIFCDENTDLNDIWGDGWESVPAEGVAQPPYLDDVAKAGIVQLKDYELDVAHNSITFGMCDVKDNVTALAWEVIDEDFVAGKQRLVFQFGESIIDVEKKLKSRNLKLIYEN